MSDHREEPGEGGVADAGPDDLISIARIVRPQGNRGEVIADLMTDFPERFARLDRVQVKRPNGEFLLLDLENSRLHKGRVVLKFAGCDDINRAEELRDAILVVRRDQAVELPEDTYYDFDLIGCEVLTTDGHRLGRVAEVQRYGAAPLLAVQIGERELLIPFTLSICVEIDIAAKRIVVDPPEGLLDI